MKLTNFKILKFYPVGDIMNTRMCLKNTLDNNYLIHSRGANTQKIKRIDHCKCNVGASKNAEQAFSTQ